MQNTMIRDSKAILFSGGLDSMCAAVLNPGHQLIRVGTGSKYDFTEHSHSRRVAAALGARSITMVDGVLDLSIYEQTDGMMPARNALIALIAAQHAVELTLVSVAGDGTHATDKDVRFADITSELLSKLFGQGSVVLPYRKWSKLQLLRAALDFDEHATLAALPWVFSCYDPGRSGMHCGHCKACVRLHGALAWADLLQLGPHFTVDPFMLSLDYIREVYDDRGEEQKEVLAIHGVCNRTNT